VQNSFDLLFLDHSLEVLSGLLCTQRETCIDKGELLNLYQSTHEAMGVSALSFIYMCIHCKITFLYHNCSTIIFFRLRLFYNNIFLFSLNTGVWTGVGLSNMKNFWTRNRIRFQKFWNRSGVRVWKWLQPPLEFRNPCRNRNQGCPVGPFGVTLAGPQRSAHIRTGSDWIRSEANFGRNRTGSDCNFFENWRIKTGSHWEN